MTTYSYPTGVLLCHSRYFAIALADVMIYQDQIIIKSNEPRVPAAARKFSARPGFKACLVGSVSGAWILLSHVVVPWLASWGALAGSTRPSERANRAIVQSPKYHVNNSHRSARATRTGKCCGGDNQPRTPSCLVSDLQKIPIIPRSV